MGDTKATLVLDLGNSETRVIVMHDKSAVTGRYEEKFFTLTNRFAEVNEDYIPSADYTTDTSTILELNAEVDDITVSGVYANGELQAKEFFIAPLRSSATERKYSVLTSALSFELAILKATQYLTGGSSVVDASDICWSVVVLLPPGDMDAGKSKISKLIRSVTHVEALFPAMSFNVNIDKVSVLPEGFCAYIATVFDKGMALRADTKYLLRETTLVFDIGAGTTDIMIVKDNKIIGVTMHSIDRGGNNVTQLVKRAIRQNCSGLSLSDVQVSEGIIKGYVKDGSRRVDIIDFINSAKDEVAKYLIADVQGYLEETEFPVRSIGHILVCGGGAIDSSSDGRSKALSTAIVDYLKRLTPYVELVTLPSSLNTGLKMTPRELNIVGASILAEAM